MPDNPVKDALYELLDYLEQVETSSGALLAFLKDNGTVTDEKLAPYLEQASTATEVKSRAIHARFDYLFRTDETAKPATEANPTPPNERPTRATGPAESTAEKDKNERAQGTPEERKNKKTDDTTPSDKAA
jgi:hypothetical protein